MARSTEQLQADSLEVYHHADDYFRGHAAVLSSFGNTAELGIYHAHLFEKYSGVRLPVVTLNTGSLQPEIAEHRAYLTDKYKLEVLEFGPDAKTIANIKAKKLWKTNPAEYERQTKGDPLTWAVEKLDLRVLFTGVQRQQSANRETLKTYQWGEEGVVKASPFLEWTDPDIEVLYQQEGLVYGPGKAKGFGSVGDSVTTVKGEGRSGRFVEVETGIDISIGGGKECPINRNTGLGADSIPELNKLLGGRLLGERVA